MDGKEIRRYARTLLLTAALLLAVTSSVYADGAITVVTSMPVPVPILPAVIPAITAEDLPEVNTSTLPAVDTSEWASSVDAIQAARSTLNAVFDSAQDQVTTVLSDASAEMGKARGVINAVRTRVGSPLSDTYARDGSTTYTVYQITYDMTNAIQFSTAYLRGMSRLGGVGLDLTFVVLGLGWMAFVNLLDLLIMAVTAFVRFLFNLIVWVIDAVKFIVDLVQLIVAVIKLLFFL
jgi:hypothetical protein